MSQINIYHIKILLIILFISIGCGKEKRNSICLKSNIEDIKNIIKTSDINEPISVFELGGNFHKEDFFKNKKCDRDCIDLRFNLDIDTILIDDLIEIDKKELKDQIKNITRQYLSKRSESRVKIGEEEVSLGLMYNIYIYSEIRDLKEILKNNSDINLLLNILTDINCAVYEIREEYSLLGYNRSYFDLDSNSRLLLHEAIPLYLNLFIGKSYSLPPLLIPLNKRNE